MIGKLFRSAVLAVSGICAIPSAHAGFDAFDIIEAEACQASYNVIVTRRALKHVERGAWIKFEDMNFSQNPTGFYANYARPDVPSGYRIDVHIDSENGTKIASLPIQDSKGAAGCSGESCWDLLHTTSTGMLSSVTGTHDVYVKFIGSYGICTLNWFYFTAGGVKPAPRVTWPRDGMSVISPMLTAITAAGSYDSDGTVGHVQFTRNGTAYKEAQYHPPFGIDVSVLTSRDRDYTYGVQYYDKNGSLMAEDEIDVHIRPRTGGRSAFVTIEAEDLDGHSGVGENGVGPDPLHIGNLDNGDWAKYKTIDFGTGPSCVDVVMAAEAASGNTLELRTGSLTGPVIGTFSPIKTTYWGIFATNRVSVSGVSGIQDLYLICRGGWGIGNIDNLTFGPFQQVGVNDQLSRCLPDTDLEKTGPMTLYDSRGRRIATVRNGEKKNLLNRDGTDVPGHVIAPGIYCYTMEQSGGTARGKIVVLK